MAFRLGMIVFRNTSDSRFLEGNQVCVVSDPDDEYPLARVHLLVRVLQYVQYVQQVPLVYMEDHFLETDPSLFL